MLLKALGLVRRHWPVLVLALVISGLMYYPQFRFERELGSEYQGIYFAYTDSEEYYAARVAEVYDGQAKLSNPYHAEYKGLPYIQPPLPEIFYAGVGKLLHWSRSDATLYGSRIVMPFIATLVVYGFVFELSGSVLLGLLGAATISLGLNLLLEPRALLDLLRGQTHFVQGQLLARPVSPQINLIFLFSFLWSFVRWRKGKETLWLVFSGILLGLTFYIYFYSWSFLLIFLGLRGLKAIKDRDWVIFKRLIFLVAIAAAIAVPYFLNLLAFSRLPQAGLLAHLQGVISSREPIFSLILIGGAALFWFLSNSLEKQYRLFFLLLFVSAFIAENQQVIVGRELHAAHYHWYVSVPLVGIGLLIAVWKLFGMDERKNWKMLTVTAMLAGLIFNTYTVQSASYAAKKDFFGSMQRYGQIFDWLNANTTKNTVVLVQDQWIADNLPTYTHNNVYTAVQPQLSDTPEDRLWFNFFLPVYLQGIAADKALAYFKANPAYVANMVGGVATRRENQGCRTCFAGEEYDKISDRYKQFLQEDDFSSRYQLDYVVVDKSKDTWPEDFLNQFQVVGQVGEFLIYRKIPTRVSKQDLLLQDSENLL